MTGRASLLPTLAAALLVGSACSSSTAVEATFDRDLDAARARWALNRPRAYSFEYAIATVWVANTGFYRVSVRDGTVVDVRHVDTGTALAPTAALTIDGIFAQLADARTRGEPLSELRFSADGVPLEAMYGTFANDGGVHFTVRRFTRVE